MNNVVTLTVNKQSDIKGVKHKVLKFLLTLSNVKQNIPSLSMRDIESKLTELGRVKLIVTVENHKLREDYHYHAFVWVKEGLSKNTYHKTFDELFPEFSRVNCINSQGVKSIGATLDYISKGVHPYDMLEFINKGKIREDSRLYTNITPKEFSNIAKKTRFYECIDVVSDIMKYDDIEEWMSSTIGRITLYTRRKAMANSIWEISRQFIMSEDKFEELIDDMEKVRYTEFERVWIKYKWRDTHIGMISHTLFILLSRVNRVKLTPKSKIPIVVGKPNYGKTSLINKFKELFGKELFYNANVRGNDFSGFNSSLQPIIVFDDVLDSTKWKRKNLIIKILAKELNIGDVKYRKVIKISYSGSIVITNTSEVLDKSEAIRSRIKKYHFNRVVNWGEITTSEFSIIVKWTLKCIIWDLKYNPDAITDIIIGDTVYVPEIVPRW